MGKLSSGICPIPQCGRDIRVKGLCKTHYIYRMREFRKGKKWTEKEEKSFWSKVKKTGDCWVWTASVVRGYGTMSINAYPTKVHRFSWMLHKGPIPDDMSVLHKCDNPICVNPKHLFLGTTTDNNKDRDNKNRVSHGEQHHSAKVTEDIVKEIRRIHVNGSKIFGVRPLARRYHLAKSTVQSIVTNKSWKRVK